MFLGWWVVVCLLLIDYFDYYLCVCGVVILFVVFGFVVFVGCLCTSGWWVSVGWCVLGCVLIFVGFCLVGRFGVWFG